MAVITKFWTLAQLRTKVEQDLDLEGEIFIQPTEILGYFNEAIEEAEKIVMGLQGDYFLCQARLPCPAGQGFGGGSVGLVTGLSLYDLPAGILAHRLRAIVYRLGARMYQIHRMRDWKKFEEYALNQVAGPQNGVNYRWFLVNQIPGEPQILFSPDVTETTDSVALWYQRQPNRLVLDTDIMDIPEAANYVMQYVKVRCLLKEGHPNLAMETTGLAKQEADLQALLAEMIPDAENELEMDLSLYGEMN